MAFLILLLFIIILLLIIFYKKNEKNFSINLGKILIVFFFISNFLYFLSKKFIFAQTINLEEINIELKNNLKLLNLINNLNLTNKEIFYNQFINKKTKMTKIELINLIQKIKEQIDDILSFSEEVSSKQLQNTYFEILTKNNLMIYYSYEFTNLNSYDYYDLVLIYYNYLNILYITKKNFKF